MPRLKLTHPGVAVIVALGFSLNGLSTDMSIASLPGIVRYFGVTVSQAQATLSAFLIAFAVSQLFYGPLSDRYGRRPMLLAGSVIYVGGSLAGALAQTIDALIAARFVQGLGCCAASVVGRAVIRDVHGAEGTARMMAYISTVTSALIVSGPVIGGVLEQEFGWRTIFIFLSALGLILTVLVAFLLEESNLHRDPSATRLRTVFSNYGVLLSDRRFFGSALMIGFLFGGILAFLSGASFVMMGLLGSTPMQFGALLGMSVFGYMGGSFVTGRYILRVGAPRLLSIGTLLAALAGTAMAALALAEVHRVFALFVPYFVFLFASGLSTPAAMAEAITPFPKMAGTASSLLGVAQLGAGGLIGLLVGRLHDGTPVPMTLAVGICAWGVVFSHYAIARPVQRAA